MLLADMWYLQTAGLNKYCHDFRDSSVRTVRDRLRPRQAKGVQRICWIGVLGGELTHQHRARWLTFQSLLQVVPISKSEAEQRAGRAGRLMHGECHRLYSVANFEAFPPDTGPEIQVGSKAP
jgi:hypothetical protein